MKKETMKIENLTQGQVLKNYKELCSALEVKEKGGDSKKAQIDELERHVNYHREGNKFVIDEIYGVAQEKTRSDKGLTRDDYNTIKEKFKPLIYNVLLTKPNFTYTTTFSNWLKETNLVEEEFIKERARVENECYYNDFTKDFINTESDSLRRCFMSALDSMSKSKKGGKVSHFKKKIAIDLDDKHIELGERETSEILNIEKELYELFGVDSRQELTYKSRKELREFDAMLRAILIDRYDYTACYTAYQVIAIVGTKEETINKSIEKAKQLYGLDNMQKVVESSKDEIYDSRLKRAESRYERRIAKREIEINAKYDERLGGWGDDDFVEFLREIELNDCYSLESYIDQWISHYKKYIHNKK